MKIFVKTLGDEVLVAPQTYKNITNFNKSATLMKQYGFEERIIGYKKSDGTMKYIEPKKWGQHKTYYTEQEFPGSDYEWNAEKETWQLKLDKAKEIKLAEIRSSVNSYMEEFKKGFSEAEIESWRRQENGAKLLSQDINSTEYDAEWVRALATNRGISVEEQMQKISNDVNLVSAYVYQLIDYQHRLEDAVNAAKDLESLGGVKFEQPKY